MMQSAVASLRPVFILLFISAIALLPGALANDCGLESNLITITETQFVNGFVIPNIAGVTAVERTVGGGQGRVCGDFFKIGEEGRLTIQNAINLDLALPDDEDDSLYCTYRMICNGGSFPWNVVFIIDYENNEYPFFDMADPFFLEISEMMPINYEVVSFRDKVKDIDHADRKNAEKLRLFISEDSTGSFEVDERNKNMWLRKQLNYESDDKELNVTLTVMDTNNHNTSTVIIVKVKDGDDQPPVFTSAHYLLTIKLADWVMGSCHSATPEILARDGDIMINTSIRYAIKNEDDMSAGHELFDMSCANSGQVRLLKNLGEDSPSHFQATLEATQHDAEDRFSRSHILIRVDRPPKMSQDIYSAFVPESSLPGSVALVVKAITDSQTPNVSFVLVDTTSSFELSPSDGSNAANVLLSLGMSLDRERTSSYVISVYCIEKEMRSAEAFIIINVTDVNDNAPSFNVTAITLSILEEAAVPEGLLITVQAEDPDAGDNRKMAFTLDGEAAELFDVQNIWSSTDEKAVISVRPLRNLTARGVSIPRNSAGRAVYRFDIVATDNGQPKLASRCRVLLTVRPATPFVVEKVQGVVRRENQLDNETLATVYVLRDVNERVRFSIRNGNEDESFEIDAVTGDIRNAKSLDKEMKGVHVLRVEALWEDGLTSADAEDCAVIVVMVADVNEAPLFHRNISAAVLNVAPVGSLVAVAQAVDPDAYGTESSRLSYELLKSDADGFLKIDATTGEVSTTSLTRDDRSSYEVMVLVTDHGVPPLNSSSWLKVTLTSLPLEKIKFSNDSYQVSVPEDLKNGSEILHLYATLNGSLSSHMRCDLVNKGSPFAVGAGPGCTIVNVGDLDREKQEIWELFITAVDSSTSKNIAAYTTVTVKILDVNDNDPTFYCDTATAEIPEGNYALSSAHSLVNLTAYDRDDGENGRLTYQISSGNEGNIFYIIDGQIFVNGTLDYESQTEIWLIVQATDNGQPPRRSSASFAVRVLDINDNCPVFDRDYDPVQVPELKAWALVATFNATDSDGTLVNSLITYEMTDESNLFHLDLQSDGSAALRVLSGLRYDFAEHHLVYVVVKDSGSPQCSTKAIPIAITVLKANDTDASANNKTLSFEKVLYSITVSRNLSKGVAVADIRAKEGRELIYRITDGNTNKLFVIDPANGTIYLAVDSDKLERRTIVLTVLAEEAGDKNAYALTVVQLRLSQPSPAFVKTAYWLEVQEEKSNLSLGFLAATPSDEGFDIVYSITSGNEGGAFSLDSKTGELFCAKALDREDRDFYQLNVQVRNLEIPRSSFSDDAASVYDEARIHIDVSDINDNPPIFMSNSEHLISGSYKRGDVIATIEASDRDKCQNITFELIGGGQFFSVNASSGEITLTGSHLRHPVSELQIAARDNCDSSGLAAFATFSIIVQTPETVIPKSAEWFTNMTAIIRDVEGNLSRILSWDVHVGRFPTLRSASQRLEASLYAMKDGEYVETTNLKRKLDEYEGELRKSYEAVIGSNCESATSLSTNDNNSELVYILAAVASAFGLLCLILIVAACRWRQRALDGSNKDSKVAHRKATENCTRPSFERVVIERENGSPDSRMRPNDSSRVLPLTSAASTDTAAAGSSNCLAPPVSTDFVEDVDQGRFSDGERVSGFEHAEHAMLRPVSQQEQQHPLLSHDTRLLLQTDNRIADRQMDLHGINEEPASTLPSTEADNGGAIEYDSGTAGSSEPAAKMVNGDAGVVDSSLNSVAASSDVAIDGSTGAAPSHSTAAADGLMLAALATEFQGRHEPGEDSGGALDTYF